MGVFDEIGKRAAKVGQNVAGEAKRLADIARINDKLKEENRKLESLYRKLGQQCFEDSKVRDYSSSPYKATLRAVEETLAAIANAIAEEKRVRGYRTCANCNNEVMLGVAFCSSCGSPMPDEGGAPEDGSSIACSNCGNPLAADAKFCVKCGNKVQ